MLHPYYKLTYIEMAWGGAEEQRKAREEGNLNAKDWCDEARQIIEKVMEEYWNNTSPTPQDNVPGLTLPATSNDGDRMPTLTSEYDRHRRSLVERTVAHADPGGWKAELRAYLGSIPADVSRDTDIVAWWSVSHFVMSSFSSIDYLQANSKIYPTLSRIAMDVCAIPATSVPCERLFSAGGEIATDRRSRLGSDKFEQLQVLRHAWRDRIVDQANQNSASVDEVNMEEFRELFQQDEELAELQHIDEVVISVP